MSDTEALKAAIAEMIADTLQQQEAGEQQFAKDQKEQSEALKAGQNAILQGILRKRQQGQIPETVQPIIQKLMQFPALVDPTQKFLDTAIARIGAAVQKITEDLIPDTQPTPPQEGQS